MHLRDDLDGDGDVLMVLMGAFARFEGVMVLLVVVVALVVVTLVLFLVLVLLGV